MQKLMIGIVFFVVVVWAWTMLFAANDADVLDADWSKAKWEFFTNDCSLVFGDPQAGTMVGAVSWCDGTVRFQGNMDESARLFFKYAWTKLIYPHWEDFIYCRERSEK